MQVIDVFDRLDRLSWQLRVGAQTRRDQNGGFRGRGRILGCLKRRGPMSQRALAATVMMQPGSLTEALGHLEQAGLVSRQRDPHDRRVIQVQLTAAGQATWQKIVTVRRNFAAQLLAGLSEAELAQLDQVVTKLMVNLQGMTPRKGERNGD